MKMLGGGPHYVGPGQVTDDSELALCMMWGIIYGDNYWYTKQSNDNVKPQNWLKILDPDYIAEYYKKWYLSPPFDIGISTTNALSCLKHIT